MTWVRGESEKISYVSVGEQAGRLGSCHNPAQAWTGLLIEGEEEAGSPRDLFVVGLVLRRDWLWPGALILEPGPRLSLL